MTTSSDTLQFRFPIHGDAVLLKMNQLREDRRFCDVTLLLGGSGLAPLRFHGHRVVLAASSDFLRDQFLLHEGRVELSIGVMPSIEVGRRLLLSCYTGLLEVPLRELVTYLTAASALQMSQVVERCARAVSQYLRPTLANLKLERDSEGVGEGMEPEPDSANPSSGLIDPCLGDRLLVEWTTPEDTAHIQGTREAEELGKVVRGIKMEFAGDAPHSFLGSEQSEVQTVHTNSPNYQPYHSSGSHRRKQRPPTPCRDSRALSPVGGSPTHEPGVADSSQDRDEEEADGPGQEEDVYVSAAHLPGGGASAESRPCHQSGPRLSVEELHVDADSLLVQRPYLCRRCDRVFQHLDSYVGHLKEHRQYLCLLCGKSFSQKSNLTRHVRVHTGVKPFHCPLCHKTFSQKATLQDHLNLHTGDRPHKCNYCAMHFAHKPGLRRHLKDIHGKSSLQNVFEELVV
ncbi:zinc finger and BTB domain-containing protein 26-like [Aplochiton taeniatus]